MKITFSCALLGVATQAHGGKFDLFENGANWGTENPEFALC